MKALKKYVRHEDGRLISDHINAFYHCIAPYCFLHIEEQLDN